MAYRIVIPDFRDGLQLIHFLETSSGISQGIIVVSLPYTTYFHGSNASQTQLALQARSVPQVRPLTPRLTTV